MELKNFHLPWGLALSKFVLIWFDFKKWKSQSDLTASEACVVLPRPPAYRETKLFPPYLNSSFEVEVEVEVDKVVNVIDQFVNGLRFEFDLTIEWLKANKFWKNFWTFLLFEIEFEFFLTK